MYQQYDPITKTYVDGTPPPDGEKMTAVYLRLSSEDGKAAESESIANQRSLLQRYVDDEGLTNVRFFADDGYSGTNFDRPGYQEMMALVEQGLVSTIVVKDHSRIGRNRLKVGMLMERLTENYDVRYVAVNSNIDSNKGFDDMVAIQELFDEYYPRETSKKIRAVFTNKGNSGQRLCTHVPYGYVGDKHGWDIDPEAAEVVREIFTLCLDGLGPMQIAKRLRAERRMAPTAYAVSKGIATPNKPTADPYAWCTRSVGSILERREYTGCTVNFKTRKKSYKSKKILQLPPEERRIFEDTHPAIVSTEVWERVQELRKNRRRPTKTGRQSMFSGLLFCADCGAKMHFSTCQSFSPQQENFRCGNYKSNTGTCSAHFIRELVLEDLVLNHLRKTLEFARRYEETFVWAVIATSREDQRRELARQGRELAQAQKRRKELDGLFKRIYEDNAAGKLSDERYHMLSAAYEDEQRQLTDQVKVLQAAIDKGEEEAVQLHQFIALVRKYTEVKELTPTIVNEFISRIEVHAPDKSSGHREQQIDIYYNFVGMVPELVEPSQDSQSDTQPAA